MNLGQHLVILSLRAYKWVVSPALHCLFGSHSGCRFSPTCSEYASEGVRRFGVFRGGWLALKRLARCHPWGDCGEDPLPEKPSPSSVTQSCSSLCLCKGTTK